MVQESNVEDRSGGIPSGEAVEDMSMTEVAHFEGGARRRLGKGRGIAKAQWPCQAVSEKLAKAETLTSEDEAVTSSRQEEWSQRCRRPIPRLFSEEAQPETRAKRQAGQGGSRDMGEREWRWR